MALMLYFVGQVHNIYYREKHRGNNIMSFCLSAEELAFLNEVYSENRDKEFSEWVEHMEAEFASLAVA